MRQSYSPMIGYSPLSQVDLVKLQRVIKVNRQIIERYFQFKKGNKILVAGSGSGFEAELLFKEYQRFTLGVDLNIHMDRSDLIDTQSDLFLSKQDLSNLGLRAKAFSLIYCYHVLEHVQDHLQTLAELERVLEPGGLLFIGFPNKKRWFAYVGTSQQASLFEKVKWNLNDLKFRLQGKFENRYGAHAGFSEKEFLSDSSRYFSKVIPVREQYLILKYPQLQGLIAFITKIGLSDAFYPSNYYICLKEAGV